MKHWYIFIEGEEKLALFHLFDILRCKLSLRVGDRVVKFTCDREQYLNAKDGHWTLVETEHKNHYEIIFK